eukprot:364866-Chlamydomonas_euryale.AAC.3
MGRQEGAAPQAERARGMIMGSASGRRSRWQQIADDGRATLYPRAHGMPLTMRARVRYRRLHA